MAEYRWRNYKVKFANQATHFHSPKTAYYGRMLSVPLEEIKQLTNKQISPIVREFASKNGINRISGGDSTRIITGMTITKEENDPEHVVFRVTNPSNAVFRWFDPDSEWSICNDNHHPFQSGESYVMKYKAIVSNGGRYDINFKYKTNSSGWMDLHYDVKNNPNSSDPDELMCVFTIPNDSARFYGEFRMVDANTNTVLDLAHPNFFITHSPSGFDYTVTKIKSQNYIDDPNFDNLINSNYKYTAGMCSEYQFYNGNVEYDGKRYISYGHSSREFENGSDSNSKSNDLTIREAFKGYNMYILEYHFHDEHRNLVATYGTDTIWINNQTYSLQGTGRLGYAWRFPIEMIQAYPQMFGRKFRLYDSTFNDRNGFIRDDGNGYVELLSVSDNTAKFRYYVKKNGPFTYVSGITDLKPTKKTYITDAPYYHGQYSLNQMMPDEWDTRMAGLTSTSHYQQMYDYFNNQEKHNSESEGWHEITITKNDNEIFNFFVQTNMTNNVSNYQRTEYFYPWETNKVPENKLSEINKDLIIPNYIQGLVRDIDKGIDINLNGGTALRKDIEVLWNKIDQFRNPNNWGLFYTPEKKTIDQVSNITSSYRNIQNNGYLDRRENGTVLVAYTGPDVEYTSVFTSFDFNSQARDKYGDNYDDMYKVNESLFNDPNYIAMYGNDNKRLVNVGDWGWGPHNKNQIKMAHTIQEIFMPSFHNGFIRVYMSFSIFNDKGEWRDVPQITVDVPFKNLNVYDSTFSADIVNNKPDWTYNDNNINIISQDDHTKYNVEKVQMGIAYSNTNGGEVSGTYDIYPERWNKNYSTDFNSLKDQFIAEHPPRNTDYNYSELPNSSVENATIGQAKPFSNKFVLNNVTTPDVTKQLMMTSSAKDWVLYSKEYNYNSTNHISTKTNNTFKTSSERTKIIYVLSNNSNLNDSSPKLSKDDIRNGNINVRSNPQDYNTEWKLDNGANLNKGLYLYVRVVPENNRLVDNIPPTIVKRIKLPDIFDDFKIVSDQWLIYEASPLINHEPTETFVSIPVDYEKEKKISSIFARAWVVDYWRSDLSDVYTAANPKRLEYAEVNNEELILKAHQISTDVNGNMGLNGHSAFYVQAVFSYTDGTQSTYRSPLYFENITLSTFGTSKHFIAARFPIELVKEFPERFGNRWSIDRVIPQPGSNDMETDFFLQFMGDEHITVNDNGHDINRHKYQFTAFRRDGKVSGVPIDPLPVDQNFFPTNSRTNILNNAYDNATNQAYGLYLSMLDNPSINVSPTGEFTLDGYSDVAVGDGALGVFITNGHSNNIENDSRFPYRNSGIHSIVSAITKDNQHNNLLYNTYESKSSGWRGYDEYGSLRGAINLGSKDDNGNNIFRGLNVFKITSANGGLPFAISSAGTNIRSNTDYILQAWVKMSNIDQRNNIDLVGPSNKQRLFNNPEETNWIRNDHWFPILWKVRFTDAELQDTSPKYIFTPTSSFNFNQSDLYISGWTLQEPIDDKPYAPYNLGDIELWNFDTRMKTWEYYGIEAQISSKQGTWKKISGDGNISYANNDDVTINLPPNGEIEFVLDRDVYTQSDYDYIAFAGQYRDSTDINAKISVYIDSDDNQCTMNLTPPNGLFESYLIRENNIDVRNLKGRMKVKIKSNANKNGNIFLKSPIPLTLNKDILDGYKLRYLTYNGTLEKREKQAWVDISSGRLNNINERISYDIDDFNLWMRETPRIIDPMINVNPEAKLDKKDPIDTFKIDRDHDLSIVIESGYDQLKEGTRWADTLHSFTNTTNVQVSSNGKDGSSEIKFINNYKSGTPLSESGTYYITSKNELRYYNPLRFNQLVTFSSKETKYQFDYYKEYIPPHLAVPTLTSEEQDNKSVNVIAITNNDDPSRNYRYDYYYTLNGGDRIHVNGKQISSENVGKRNETNIWNFTEKGDYVFYIHYANDDFPDGAEINTVFTIGDGNIHFGGDDGYIVTPGEYPNVNDYPPPQDWIPHDSYEDDDNAFYNDIRYHSPWFNMKKEVRTINIFGKKYAIDPNIDYNVFDNGIFDINAWKTNYPYYNDHIHTIGENILQTGKTYFKPDGINRTDNELDITKKADGHNHLFNRTTKINMIDQTKPVIPEYIATSDTALPPWESHKDMPLASTDDITFRLQNPSNAYECKCYIDGVEYTPGTKYTKPGTHWFYAIYRDKHNYLVSYSQPQKFIIEKDVFYSPPFIDYMPKRIYSEFYDVSIDYFFYDHQLGVNDEESDLDELGRPRVKQKLYKLGENDTWKEYTGKIRITRTTTIYARKVYTDNYHFDVTLTIEFNKFNYDTPSRPSISDFGDPSVNGGNLSVYIPTVQKKLGYMYREWINGIPYTPGTPITNYERNRRRFFYTVEVTNVINMERSKFTKVFDIDTRAPEKPKIKGLIQGMIVNWDPNQKFELDHVEKGVQYTFTINGNNFDINQPLRNYYNGKTNSVYKIIAQAKRTDNGMANTSIYYIDLNEYNTTKYINNLDKPRNVLLPYNRDNNYFQYPGELIVNSRTGDLSIVSDVSKGDGSYKIVDVTENISNMLRVSSNAIGGMFKMIPIFNEKVRWLSESYKFINENNDSIDNFYRDLDTKINDLYNRLQNLDKASKDNENDIAEMKKELDRQREIIMTGEFHNAWNELNDNIRNQLPVLRERYINFMKDYFDIASVVALSYYNLDNINELANKKVTVDQFNRYAKQIIDYGKSKHDEFNRVVDDRSWLDPTDFGFTNPYF